MNERRNIKQRLKQFNGLLLTRRSMVLWFCAVSLICAGQNMVPNGGFEEYESCPDSYGQINMAEAWFKGGIGSPDFYNSCAAAATIGVPENFAGYQIAASGNGYCGMACYSNAGPGYGLHEIIGVRLLEPLVIGELYFASFKVSWTTGSPNVELAPRFASNNTGILCTVDSLYGESDWYPWPNHAQVSSPSVISDSLAWTTISGQFIADSAYRFLWVGNFFDDPSTVVTVVDYNSSDQFSYYYVDDVCLTTTAIDCAISALPDRQEEVVHVHYDRTTRKLVINGLRSGWHGVAEVHDIQGGLLEAYEVATNDGSVQLTMPVRIVSNNLVVLRLRGEDGVRCYKLFTY